MDLNLKTAANTKGKNKVFSRLSSVKMPDLLI